MSSVDAFEDKGGEAGQEISFTVGIEEAEPRAGEWGSWEQARTRSFFAAAATPIDDQGLLGTIANKKFELACRRTAAGGFEGSWSLSLEERVGPNRIHRGEGVGYILAGNTRLLSFRTPQFARACGTRTHSWSGTLTREQFDQVTGFQIYGDVEVRRC